MNVLRETPATPEPPTEGPASLDRLLAVVSRRRGAFGLTLAGALLLAVLAALLMEPRYLAEAVVLVDARKTQVAGIPEVMTDLPSDVAAVRSEMAMIRSNDLVATVVDRLRLDQDPEFAPRERVLPFLRTIPHLAPYLPTEAEAAAKRRLALLDRVRERLTTGNDGRSYNIQIGFRSREPAKAARIANAFADSYVAAQVDIRHRAARTASTWLETRLAELRDRVAEAEGDAQAYRERSNLNESMGATSVSRELAELNANLAKVRDDRSRAEARVEAVRNAGDLANLPDVVASPLIHKLREQEAVIRQREVELSSRYSANHPVLRTIAAQAADIRLRMADEMRRIAAAASNDLDVANRRQSNIEKQIAQLESRNAGLLRADVQLRELERVAEASRLVYETFLSRLRETSQEQHLAKADARVVSHATAPVKSRFPIPVILAAGLFAGLVAAVLAALWAEARDKGFRTSGQVEAETGIPVAGLLPLLRRSEGTPEARIRTAPDSVFTEAARTIAGALGLGDTERRGQIVLVSSAVPGEGKTSAVATLARLLAAGGRRVLTVEADLRRPALAAALGLAPARRPGLAAVLRGECQPIQAIVPAGDNVQCLPAGAGAADLKHLLGSPEFRRVLHGLRAGFDVVLVDAPPAMALADPLLMAPFADQRLLVVRWGATPREAVAKAAELFRRHGAPLDAVVLNQVDLTKQARYDLGGYGYCVTRYRAYYGA